MLAKEDQFNPLYNYNKIIQQLLIVYLFRIMIIAIQFLLLAYITGALWLIIVQIQGEESEWLFKDAIDSNFITEY